MGNVYPFRVNLLIQLSLKKWVNSYRMIINSPLPKNMMYYAQFWYDTTSQHFRFYDSSEFKYASGEAIDTETTCVRNKATLNVVNNFVGNDSCMDTSCIL